MFKKYMHVERMTSDPSTEIDGLLTQGNSVYIFPKLDGANHCAWYDGERGEVRYASRNQVLTEQGDRTGFYRYAMEHPNLYTMCTSHPDLIFYGEFLTPHTIKTYRNDAWNRWYVFDVYDQRTGRYMAFPDYAPILDEHGVDCVEPLAQAVLPLQDGILNDCMESNRYLMAEGVGEGIVVKNYDFVNQYGRQVWGKMVRSEFKVESRAKDKPLTEVEELVERTLTPEYLSKEYLKMTKDAGVAWNDKMTPDLLKTAYAEWKKDYYPEVFSLKDTFCMKDLSKAFNRRLVFLLHRMRGGLMPPK